MMYLYIVNITFSCLEETNFENLEKKFDELFDLIMSIQYMYIYMYYMYVYLVEVRSYISLLKVVSFWKLDEIMMTLCYELRIQKLRVWFSLNEVVYSALWLGLYMVEQPTLGLQACIRVRLFEKISKCENKWLHYCVINGLYDYYLGQIWRAIARFLKNFQV